jgi:rhodanese-related sulfurtransferase
MSMITEVASGKAQLLDVRTVDEWGSGHAEYAVHIPVDELLNGNTGSLESDKKIYVYCRSGGRAGTATAYLQAQGFLAENVGGLGDWLRAGGALSAS